MRTRLNEAGQVGIPEQIRDTDHLRAGDSFELERLTSGLYLLSRQASNNSQFVVVLDEAGLPIIRAEGGTLTSQMVKELLAH